MNSAASGPEMIKSGPFTHATHDRGSAASDVFTHAEMLSMLQARGGAWAERVGGRT